MPNHWELWAFWVIYVAVGANATAVPSTQINNVMDIVEQQLPGRPPYQNLGLSGVQEARILGKCVTDEGDFSPQGQGFIVVPIRIFSV
jgi:hypothetical protein